MTSVNVYKAAHAESGDPESALEACLQQLLQMDGEYTLGFVYVTDPMASELPRILERLRQATRVVNWAGSVGTAICGGREESYHQPAISVLLCAFPVDCFRVFGPVTDDWSAFEREHGSWLETHQPYVGIVHGDPRVPWLQSIISGLSDRMGDGFLVGGLSSSNTPKNQIANDVLQGGLSGVLFGREIALATRVSQGCEAASERHEVTRCEGNVVFELDGRPATDVFVEVAGAHFGDKLHQAATSLLVGLPVRGSDTGDYVVRNLLALDPDEEALVVGENLNPGDPLFFCLRNAEVASRDLKRALDELTRGGEMRPRAGVYFSCIARGAHLFGAKSIETGLIQQALGDIPLTGFYANGEISSTRVYTYTGVLSVFR